MFSPDLLSRFWPALQAALMRLRTLLPPLKTLTRAEGRHFRAWLGALETLARKAVLVEAATLSLSLSLSLAPPLAQRRASASSAAPRRSAPARQRKPSLRLWPRTRLPQRITALGPPTSAREIWRARRRAALIARLAAARGKRKPAHIRFADRLDALERLIAAPAAAARRLARKLMRAPTLAKAIAAAPQAPALYVPLDLAHGVCRQGRVVAHRDTS